MKCQAVLPACLLLLWTLTASVSCNDVKTDKDPLITAKKVSDGIVLTCKDDKLKVIDQFELKYKDESTGEYTCNGSTTKVYVKFRTCENCIELDLFSIMGIVIGDVVATTVMGVAVYLIASLSWSRPITSHKKSSDRQHLVPNEVSNRAANEHYQPLRAKGQKDTYDVLTNRR